MKTEDRPPADVYAGTGSVQASRDATSAGIRIAFSGRFTVGELGSIIAWAVDLEALRQSSREN